MSCVSPLSNASVGSGTNGVGEALSSVGLGWLLVGWVSSLGCSGVGSEGEVGIGWIGWLRVSACSTWAITFGGIGSKGSCKGSILALSSPGLFGM